MIAGAGSKRFQAVLASGRVAGIEEFRGSGSRGRFRGWKTIALLVAVLVLVGCDDADGFDGSAAFVADGTVVAESMSVKEALRDASERVGYKVLVPRELAEGWTLTTIRIHAGPVGQLTTLLYRAGEGHLLEVTQMPPERGVSLAAGSSPREIDAGVKGVEAAVIQSPGKTTLAWDSDSASYVAVYGYPSETNPEEAEAFLVGLLGSMK